MSYELLRMLERIIIAGGGILAIWLGYQLFKVADIKTDSGGSLKSSLFTVSLTKVGPGVFFALFGAYVLATGLTTPVRSQYSDRPNPGLLGLMSSQKASPDEFESLIKEIDKLPDGAEKARIKGLVESIERNSKGSLFIGHINPDELPAQIRDLMPNKGVNG